MRQEQFVARHQREWQRFEHWLETRGDTRRALAERNTGEIGDEDIPALYRRLCQQLALARKRGYSPVVTLRLQELMQRGHNLLYRTPPPRWQRAAQFLLADFPRLVRSEAGCMWAAAVLFVVPLVSMYVLLQSYPELIHGLMSPQEVAQLERMYDPSSDSNKLGRESGSDWAMFGHYIMNNISIGLRTFASGLLAGVGTILVLIFNGITIGAVFGHLQQIGSGDPLWRFVAGHAPFELTAIVLAGGAGLRLGFNLIAPGRRTRLDALVAGGITGARLCLGVAFMLLVAAFIEAFWSSTQSIPAAIKYTVSGVLWTLVFAWLWRGGRGERSPGERPMRLEQMTVHLRARSAWEAMELGTALVRRHAAAIWKPWLLMTLPVFVALNAMASALDAFWLAGVLMWWLKPAFDRIPLFVISRATFGATPGTRETLAAQLRWGWKPLLHHLTWRRLSPTRSLYLPIDLLEGVQGGQRLGERRRVLGSAVYGNAVLLTVVCMHFEIALMCACIALAFMFVPFEYLPEAARAAWSLVLDQPPWWAWVGANLTGWIAITVIEPFFVGAGFGLYLNRRTQIEAWDVEIAFRKLRTRLTSTASSLAMVLALTGTVLLPARAQQPATPATTEAAKPESSATRAPTLPHVFGDARVDESSFSKAVDQAYRDPLLDSKRTQVTWEKRDKSKQEKKTIG